MQPYFYKIQEISSGKYYVGCQWGKKSNPKNFWVQYFTSSTYIKKQPKENYKIIKVVVRPDARQYEARYLKKAFGILGKERFFQLFLNKHCIDFGIVDPESIEKRGKLIANSTKGMKPWFKGSEMIRAFECPGNGWVRGFPNSRNEKIKKSLIGKQSSLKGMKYSEEQKAGRRARGLKFWNNGTEHRLVSKQPGPDWKPGMLFIPKSQEHRNKIAEGRRRWAQQKLGY